MKNPIHLYSSTFSTSILLALLIIASNSFALEVEVKMLAQGSAVLQVDGKPHMLRDGGVSPEGVKLISADGKQAVVEVDGKRKSLNMSRDISKQFTVADKTEVRIASSEGNHYRVKGLINGKTVNFFVDTGATTIAMNFHEAERLGIDYRAGTPTKVNTANGLANAFQVTLQSVSVGNIVVHQVAANVSDSDALTEVLLGNSYLSKVNLQIDQGVLVLKEK